MSAWGVFLYDGAVRRPSGYKMQSSWERRRINGPEESFPPTYEEDEDTQGLNLETRQGRGPSDIRPICMFLSQQ